MTKRWTLVFVSTFALALGACGEGQWPGPAAAPLNAGPGASQLYQPEESSGVVGVGWTGDWFTCFNAACQAVIGDGIRLRSDNTAVELEVFNDDFVALKELRYCVDERKTTTWDRHGDVLLVGQRGVLVYSLDGNKASIGIPQDGGTFAQAYMIRVAPPAGTAPCEDDTPPVPGF